MTAASCNFCSGEHQGCADSLATRANAVAEQLLKACNGHPAAEIPWPHRLLHDAEGIIRELLAEKGSGLGSAETGGEKAASQEVIAVSMEALCKRIRAHEWEGYGDLIVGMIQGRCGFPECSCGLPRTNFRRGSQNQTVSSGVEGAHEGTTADKKGESK